MKTQQIGSFRVDRIMESEGPYAPVSTLLPGAPAELIDENADWLMPGFVDPTDRRVILSFHSFLVRTGRHTILVDACVGNEKHRPARPDWHLQNKPYLATLARAGLRPEEIDFVFCTHLHADHVGWNTRLDDGRWVPTFPNARYLFARREYEYWERTHRELSQKGGDPPAHGAFADSVLPLMEAGRAVLVDSDHQIEDGVYLEPAYGHTPGACVLHARSGAHHALFTGDIMHTPVQLARPALSSRSCADPVASARVRVALCERYADSATVILAAHFPTPVAGRIVRHREAFRLQA
jgi:glyoxylase-like metal-dependent hydrolase (beta-lactamase superfamily II)